MKQIYIVIWHEATDAAGLVAGIFNDEQNALEFQDKLNTDATDNYWEVIVKDAPID